MVGCRRNHDIARPRQPTCGRRARTTTSWRPHAAHHGIDAVLDQRVATILIGGGASQPSDLLTTAVWGVPISSLVAVLSCWRPASSVLFRQLRPELLTEPFGLVKFRWMTDERDADSKQLPTDNAPRSLARFAPPTSMSSRAMERVA